MSEQRENVYMHISGICDNDFENTLERIALNIQFIG